MDRKLFVSVWVRDRDVIACGACVCNHGQYTGRICKFLLLYWCYKTTIMGWWGQIICRVKIINKIVRFINIFFYNPPFILFTMPCAATHAIGISGFTLVTCFRFFAVFAEVVWIFGEPVRVAVSIPCWTLFVFGSLCCPI